MKIKSLFNKPIFPLLSIFLLTIGFNSNFFQTSNQKHFLTFQNGDESFILGRLAISERDGLFSNGGFNGKILNPEIPNTVEGNNFQYEAYLDNLEINNLIYDPYQSQSGGQGMLYSTLNFISPFTNKTNLNLFRLINSMLSAIAFTFLLIWVRRQFNSSTAIISLILILASSWITVFGDNLWWALWAFYTPLLLLLFLFINKESFQNPLSLRKIATLTSIGLFFKCYFNGLEYISAILIMGGIPFIFYSILHKWELRTFLIRFSIYSISSILTVVLSLFLLATQINMLRGSLRSGWDHIIYSFTKRSMRSSPEVEEIYNRSLNAPLSEVIQKYFNKTAFDLNQWTSIFWDSTWKIDFGELILIFLCISIFTLASKKYFPNLGSNRRLNLSLITTLWISMLAPLSWFIIFKGHSFIHFHMNAIVWYFPFCLFGFILIGSVMTSIFKDLTILISKQTFIPKKIIKYSVISTLLLSIFGLLNSIDSNHKKFTNSTIIENRVYKNEKYELFLADNSLWYVFNEIEDANILETFFLHIYPKDTMDLSETRKKYGFENLDFKLTKNQFKTNQWWSNNEGSIYYKKNLPPFSIKLLKTGQFNSDGKIWSSGIIKNN